MTVTTIGIDLAKSVFQIHGADAEGRPVLRRRLRRRELLAFFEVPAVPDRDGGLLERAPLGA